VSSHGAVLALSAQKNLGKKENGVRAIHNCNK
jgi:hypothetical protein